MIPKAGSTLQYNEANIGEAGSRLKICSGGEF